MGRIVTTRIDIISDLMGLRAKSWRLSQKEDNLLNEIHSTILYRAEVDKEIDRLENALMEIKKQAHPEPEPRGAWSWMQ